MYAATVRAGLPTEFRRALLPHFEKFQIPHCPFWNLPDRTEGRWGEGLTAGKMSACRWLEPVPGCTYRISGMDARKPTSASALRWHSQRQRCARGCARINRVGRLILGPPCLLALPDGLPEALTLFGRHLTGVIANATMHNRLAVDTDPWRKAVARWAHARW